MIELRFRTYVRDSKSLDPIHVTLLSRDSLISSALASCLALHDGQNDMKQKDKLPEQTRLNVILRLKI